MSNTTISPNMNLPVPTVSTDPGPDWANNVVACLSIIDGHNHSLGEGVQIGTNGINITADFPQNNNNLTLVRSLRFNPQSAPISNPTDLGCLFESGVDLYYIDGSGNLVRITQSGTVTGSTGTITGLPSGTASASFAGSTFTFDSATNTPAQMAVGPLIIGQNILNSKTVTISPSSSQASNYALVFPIALPSVQSTIVSDNAGNLSFSSLNSGSYTPTLTDLGSTLSLTPSVTYWYQVGNVVTVSGVCAQTNTSATNVSFSCSLPVAPTTFSGANQAGGSGINERDSLGWSIIAGGGHNYVIFTASAGSGILNSSLSFTFSYRIS